MMNKINKKGTVLILLILFIFLFSFFVYADTTYPKVGGTDSYYDNSKNKFIDGRDVDINSRGFSEGKNVPLVDDLDGDGVNEIVGIDGNEIVLFLDNTLYNNKAVLINDNNMSNMILFDIDNDGFKEVIVAEIEDENVYILEYNGTDFYKQYTIPFNHLFHNNNGDVMLNCRDTNDCLLVYSTTSNFDSNSSNLIKGITFGSTGFTGSETTIYTGTWAAAINCFPIIKDITITDYDNADGDEEYIFSSMENDNTGVPGDVRYNIHYVDVSGTTITTEKTIYSESSSLSSNTYCTDQDRRSITPVLVADVDNQGDGDETIIGYMKNSDEFKIDVYDPVHTGDASQTTFPNLADADGQILGNVFLANVFDNTGFLDFCVVGFLDDTQRMDVLCANYQEKAMYSFLGVDYEDVQFFYDYSEDERFNLTNTDYYNMITHSIKSIGSDNSLSEIINGYGTFYFTIEHDILTNVCSFTDEFLLAYRCTITKDYEIPYDNSAVIPIDYQQYGWEDLIVLTDTNIHYIDDTFANSPPTLTASPLASIDWNPCYTETWQINTSFEIRLTGIDEDGTDQISYKVDVYADSDNEMTSGWTSYVPSGTTRTIINLDNFKINKTDNDMLIRLSVRDDFNNVSNIENNDYYITVANEGVVKGDIDCLVVGESVEDEDDFITTNSTYTIDDNELLYTLVDISNMSGLPPLLFIIILMLGVDLMILLALHWYPTLAIGGILLFDIGLLIIVSLMGFIGSALIITFFALIIIAGGFWATQQWNRVSGGGGGG